jgi:hypothetical protein
MLRLKNILISGAMLVLSACTPWVSVVVAPDNFAKIKSQFDTFLLGSYIIDQDYGIYLDFQGAEPDLLLNRVYTHAFSPGKPDYFIIPIPAGSHFIRTVNFSYEPYDRYGDGPYYPYDYGVYGWMWGSYRFRYYYFYDPYSYYYYSYPPRIFPYPFIMNLEKGKIYYIGRFILTDNNFMVENHYEEDRNALQATFLFDTNGYIELTNSVYTNLLK